MIDKRNNKGFSLVELMIALVVGSMLIAAAAATYVAQNKSYVAQETVSEVNTQTKISHDIIANEIRNAGFGWPERMDHDLSYLQVIGRTNFITPAGSSIATDGITISGGLRYLGMAFPFGYSANAIGLNCVNPNGVIDFDDIYEQDGTPTNRISIDPPGDANDQEVIPVNAIISIDGHFVARVAACAVDMNGDCIPQQLTLDRAVRMEFPIWDSNADADSFCDRGRPVYVYEDHTYCVDGNSSLVRIRRGGDPGTCSGNGASITEELAQNIQDFQLRYATDANGDGIIDVNGNGQFDNPEDFVDMPALIDHPTIKAVRINILAVADREDPNYQGMGSPPAAIANRSWAAATPDNFRRRWLRTMVRIRNR
jgi:type IV pilus assembly protein PilW